MTLFETSSTPVRKPRTGKKTISMVEATSDLRLHAELHPPLAAGAQHTVPIKKGTEGIVCGPAPDGMDGFVVAFNFARHHTATAVVTREQVVRLST